MRACHTIKKYIQVYIFIRKCIIFYLTVIFVWSMNWLRRKGIIGCFIFVTGARQTSCVKNIKSKIRRVLVILTTFIIIIIFYEAIRVVIIIIYYVYIIMVTRHTPFSGSEVVRLRRWASNLRGATGRRPPTIYI